jgi:uncharacterized protein (TIGR02466 family)|tara:strand:+ start:474 stop:1046 length:573 start_codon:yes stop_codon:yes gene_type:complete
MDSINIFCSTIFVDLLKNKDFDKAIKEELIFKEKNNKSNILSNRGGFQSDTIKNPIIIDTLEKNSFAMLNSKYTSLSSINCKVLNCWLNVNKKNNWNIPHVHHDSHYSGTYYLDVPDDSGNLTFFREFSYSFVKPNIKGFEHNDFAETFDVVPKKNMIVLFPSNLLHMVNPNSSHLSRTSLSFNIGLSDN